MARQARALLALCALFAVPHAADAAIVARYDFSSGSVTNSTTSTAAASSVAASPAGTTASLMTLAGSSTGSSFSISGTTNTAYIAANLTANSFANAITLGRYHTFNASLTNPYTLTGLTFDFGGSNNFVSTTVNINFGVQAQIGAGAFNTIGTAVFAMPPGMSTSSINLGGSFSALLNSTFENLSSTTVTFRIYTWDADTVSSAHTTRFKNVVLSGFAVPTPAALPAGLALMALGVMRRRH
ncbi:MAG: hypothetical protein GC162_17075 [Planctomycetes bacterium]|nr:hypothetical protein [Planctomycetota bacterium]